MLGLPRLGLGVGLDLPWGAPIGLSRDPDRVTDRVARFLERHAGDFAYGFISYQPRGREVPRASALAAGFDDALSRLRGPRALHHTTLNLAAAEPYPRGAILDFTNQLIERHRFEWVNEDLGLWSLGGRPLPYPLPPQLTRDGLAACVRGVREVARGLCAPLVVEFPGFAEGVSVRVGDLDAYDFFREVIEAGGVLATLDVGHLLSYQWLRGRRGEALYDDLERLPLAHTVELHLSGCGITGERFMDYHHGVLLEEQLELTRRLLARCPALRAVTYEDPKFDAQGVLIPNARPGFERLQQLVAGWMAVAQPAEPVQPVQHAAALIAIDDAAATRAADLDREVDRLLHDAGARAAFLKRPPANGPLASLRAADLEHAARVIVRETLHRRQLGCGDLAGAYARTLAGRDVTALLERFLASQAYARHREVPLAGLGICLEEAFYRFAADDPSIDQTTLTHEFLAAMVRALAVSPEPGFTVPPELRACPGGHFALHGEGPHLYAITRGRIVSGAVTPLLADLLTGAAPPAAAPAAHAQLCALGLC